MSETRRIAISNQGPDEAKVAEAIKAGVDSCLAQSEFEMTIVMSAKNVFSDSIVGNFLNKKYGKDTTKKLLKGEKIRIENGVSIKFTNISTIGSPNVILAAYVSGKDMGKVDSVFSAKAIIYLPWLSDEGERWDKQWNEKPALNSDVELRLKRLTTSVNLANGYGLGHPSDIEAAKKMFQNFEKENIEISPEEIRKWAVQNGWPAIGAQRLFELAEK